MESAGRRSRVGRMTKITKPVIRASAARAAAVSPVMKGGMPRALGIRIVSLSRKKVVGEMPIKPMHINNSGSVNGGAIMSFADVMGAAGAVAHRPPGYRGGTIESKTNFFAAGRGPVLSAVSIPLHVGRTTSVWQTTIKNPDGRVVAIVTQTQIMIPHERERTLGARKQRSTGKQPARGKMIREPIEAPGENTSDHRPRLTR